MSFQEQAKEAIRASGGRITGQRELLLDLIAAHDEIDAERLHQLAVQQDATISLPTVYRTLHTLEDAHVITSRYFSTDHERKVYSVQAELELTFHFTCRRCGRVIPFQSTWIEQLKRELGAQLGAEVLTLCMCAGGLCPDCREEKQNMTLDQLQAGQTAIVRHIGGQGQVRRRLMDMGLTKGAVVEMIKAAPMGDPVEYRVRAYHLSLRKSEAAVIEIELTQQETSA